MIVGAYGGQLTVWDGRLFTKSATFEVFHFFFRPPFFFFFFFFFRLCVTER